MYKEVTFNTGLCVINTSTGNELVTLDTFKVKFRNLTDLQIKQYLEFEKPFNCAGSFKSEGLGISLFESMSGDDPNSLVGLPLIRLTQLLLSNGYDVFAHLPK